MKRLTRRELMATGAAAMASTTLASAAEGTADEKRGEQRLPLEKLRAWEQLRYGMFIHFGMSTFVANELPDGKAPASVYNPSRLDVDQWIQVARDAGMKYAVLTTKHVAGHCLWPSKHSDYSVAQSGNKSDVVELFVEACRKHGIEPGFYYCSWDNHNRFGSQTPSDPPGWGAAYTTSLYQTFQTNQVTELLTQYGPIAEVWVDIPGVLGPGYRTFLYEHIARLQPNSIIMMNHGIGDGSQFNAEYAWPTDIIAIERALPPEGGHKQWRTVEGKQVYLPGEVCDPLGKEWFWVEGDAPRPADKLAEMARICRERNASLLLDVPPNREGVIPRESVEALMRLRKKAGI